MSKRSPHQASRHGAQQLRLEDELALFVLLRRLVRAVVLPANNLVALPAGNVAHNVSAGRHAAVAGLAEVDVDDLAEQKGLAMLAAEVLRESE